MRIVSEPKPRLSVRILATIILMPTTVKVFSQEVQDLFTGFGRKVTTEMSRRKALAKAIELTSKKK